MRRLFVIWVALVGSCGDSEVERLASIKDQVCACKDAACAETAMKQVPQHDIKSTKRTQKLGREMLDCLAKLYAANAPSTDPDHEAPAPAQDPAAARRP